MSNKFKVQMFVESQNWVDIVVVEAVSCTISTEGDALFHDDAGWVVAAIASGKWIKIYKDNAIRSEYTEPEVGEVRPCLVCGQNKPWGIFDSRTGATICVECRDKARA